MDPEHQPRVGSDVDVLRLASTFALAYAAGVDDRRVAPDNQAVAALAAFDEPLPDVGIDESATLRLLNDVGSPATVASTGRRYFGFVNGATYPVALGSSWLASSWDQNAALPVMSPVAAKLHDVRARLARRPPPPSGRRPGWRSCSGATVANASCLAAARDALLAGLGWDVQSDGLFGAPRDPGRDRRSARTPRCRSRSASSGSGRTRVHVVPADDQGRLRADDAARRRRAGAGLRAGGRGQHRRVRPLRRDRRLVGRAVGLAARRRCVRHVGARRPDPGRTRARARPGRFVGDRCATSG